MKKKILCLALAATIMGSTAYAAQNEAREPDMWVFNETSNQILNDAIKAQIIQSGDYDLNQAVNREQFCEFAYNMVNSVKELPVAKLARNPFDDVSNYKINALAFVKIINGKGDYIFAPQDKITREEAAVILCRMAEYMEIEFPSVKIDMSYSDNELISDWAISDVYKLKVLDIMQNKNDGLFNPQADYTVGETLSSLVKLYNMANK